MPYRAALNSNSGRRGGHNHAIEHSAREPAPIEHSAREPAPMPPVADSGTGTAKAAEHRRLAANPAGVIYGLIAIDALLAAESGVHETFPDAVASAVIAAALYWLGHAYATALGERLRGGAHLSFAALRQALAHDWAI